MGTMGIEPMTNGLLDQRSTDWAMRPNHEIKNFQKNYALAGNWTRVHHLASDDHNH